MFSIYDGVRLTEFEARSALPNAPVREDRPARSAAWSTRARLAVSGELHRLADALAPSRETWEPKLSSEC
jgi:hypothetical protein